MVGYEIAQGPERRRPLGRELILLGLLWVAVLPAWARPAQPKQVEVGPSPVTVEGESAAVESSVESVPNLRAVPADARVTRHHVDAKTGNVRSLEVTDGAAGGVADLVGRVIYSNRPEPGMLLAPGAGNRIADDVTTVALEDCSLSGVELRISGGGDGTGEGFDVEFALYDGCPNDGGQIIEGSERSLSFDHDGVHLVLIDLLDSPVTIPREIWAANTFSRDGAGWVMGEPATIGFTANRYDMPDEPCIARMSGTNIIAGFAIRLYAIGSFEQEHTAYLNGDFPGFPSVPFGANQWIADDIQLNTQRCVLTGYEIAGHSLAMPFAVEAELWESCDPESVIEGTQATGATTSGSSLELFRFGFPAGVLLPENQFWVAWRYDSPKAAAVLSGQAELGATQDIFALWEINDPDECGVFFFGGRPYAGFRINVYCQGQAPLGACCDVEALGEGTGEATCSSTTEIECLGAFKHWTEGKACPERCFATNAPCNSDDDCRTCSLSAIACVTDDDCPGEETCWSDAFCGAAEDFDAPCGTHACCTPPLPPYGEGCVNLTREACEAIVDEEGRPAYWHFNEFCDSNGHSCARWACRVAENNCAYPHDEPGCASMSCCEQICAIDPWCCDIAWDVVCQAEACARCADFCPPACIEFIAPMDGGIDARQPHPPYDATNIQTFTSIVADHVPVACKNCWELCDTAELSSDINLESMEHLGGERYRLHFDRVPPWPTSVNVRYINSASGCSDADILIAIAPGNADGNDEINEHDIAKYEEFLAGDLTALHFIYSCDIDRSGECNPADILRLIDLMNGGGDYEPMFDKYVPWDSNDCN